MKGHALALALALLSGCHRRGRHRAPGPSDPRLRLATACEDPRYVMAPPRATRFLGPLPAVDRPALAGSAGRVLVAAAHAAGAVAWVEGEAQPAALEPGPVLGDLAAVGLPAGAQARFVVAWTRAPGTELRWLDARGAVRAQVTLPRERAPSMAYTSGALAVATLVGGEDLPTVRLRLFDARGRAVRDAVALGPAGVGRAVAVTAAGARFALVWSGTVLRPGLLRFATVDLGGGASAVTDVLEERGAVGRVALAYGGGRVALVWTDTRSGVPEVYSTAVDLEGRCPPGVQQLSVRAELGARPSVVWDGGAFGAAWSEPLGPDRWRSYVALLDTGGLRIGTQVRLWEPDEAVSLKTPSLVFTGRGYALASARGDGAVELRHTGPRLCDQRP
ncbi:MAG: hypothetical protein HY909_16935 [Deltaproteobacteria bacterium]|nr:hypothetical protein [Deltaproteobacteria bacterium]